ncbi:hypothetical protein ACIA5C_48290 [Actinoplanes sp. NPDC051343]|uniref:hypothetical protein n=1 Tax=Actinoplanes sp. NPDC051343 TaxID=3363906 RepID=UPI0037B2F976
MSRKSRSKGAGRTQSPPPEPTTSAAPGPAAAAPSKSEDGKKRFDRRIAIATLLVAVLAAGGGYLTFVQGLFKREQHSLQVVLDPEAGPGGIEIYAVPKTVEDQPVDYLASGTLTAIDCTRMIPIDNAGNFYMFLRIAKGNVDADRWIASNKAILSNGDDITQAVRRLPSCSKY